LNNNVGVEEMKKERANRGKLIGSMPLYSVEDRRKRRDPV
jgi:hypothetical protein